MPTCIRLINI